MQGPGIRGIREGFGLGLIIQYKDWAIILRLKTSIEVGPDLAFMPETAYMLSFTRHGFPRYNRR